MPVPLPPKRRPLLRQLARRPWTLRARTSPALRKWCDAHGYVTPHFSWRSYACQDGTAVPRSLKPNAIRLHWRLELMRHRLGDVSMTVDGPYRTRARNTAVGGARDSRHVHADAADFFVGQIDGWVKRSRRLKSRGDVIRIAERCFANGGVGNEGATGTLHVDARGRKARFVSWTRT